MRLELGPPGHVLASVWRVATGELEVGLLNDELHLPVSPGRGVEGAASGRALESDLVAVLAGPADDVAIGALGRKRSCLCRYIIMGDTTYKS